MILPYPYLIHNTMNKNCNSLTVLYKISYITGFKINSSFLSTEAHQQMLPDYEDLITSL